MPEQSIAVVPQEHSETPSAPVPLELNLLHHVSGGAVGPGSGETWAVAGVDATGAGGGQEW